MLSTRYRPTLFGRSLFLAVAEITANAVCWTAAGILFGRHRDTRPILNLALLAWTLGLRHALDADHISAIDNATRGLISLGQLPVTCGLFFSLGHSTIVIVVIVAIAISSDVYEKMQGVGTVGGIVGAAVSGSFLFLIGLANSVILWRIIKQRRRERKRVLEGGDPDAQNIDPKHNHTLMMRILGPIMTFVDRPWKMYPVGVLFGFGFDTASSIALLAISAIAKKQSNGTSIPSSYIVILPLLFTAGMTMIDSLDSILMLYSYSGFPERSWRLFERKPVQAENSQTRVGVEQDAEQKRQPTHDRDDDGAALGKETHAVPKHEHEQEDEARIARDRRVKMNVMSGLSIVLTLMSILVAFSISLITIMSLIGEECAPCLAAAESEDADGGGLAGRWWRGWAEAGDNSGYIGAGIVGAFVAIVGGWYGWRWVLGRRKGVRREGEGEGRENGEEEGKRNEKQEKDGKGGV